nr:hypothetical protein [Enterococcus casseliflavus]
MKIHDANLWKTIPNNCYLISFGSGLVSCGLKSMKAIKTNLLIT